MPVETPFSHALGSALLHFVWQGALIALVLAAGLFVFRPSSARVRYALACLSMLAMLASFAATLALSWPHPNSTIPLHTGPRFPGGVQGSELPLLGAFRSQAEQRVPWLVFAWMLGAGVFAIRSVVSWTAARRLRKIGVCAAAETWQRRVRDLAARLQVSKPVGLLESCLTQVPAVIGFFRPVILTPAGLLLNFPPEQIDYILLHELAHIRRCDYLVNLLQNLAEDLLFYHPAVWWVSGIVRAERENCCDDLAVAVRGDAHGLAAALAALEQYRSNAGEFALAANGGHLMLRIRRLLEGQERPRTTAAPVFFAGLLLASAALSLHAVQAPALPSPVVSTSDAARAPARAIARPSVLLAQAPVANSPATNPAKSYRSLRSIDDSAVFQKQQAEAQQQLLQELGIPAPFRNWLNEDVVYIITKEEREAFRRLKTDEERGEFIKNFWLRRDPTPGTPENEYIEEHYRRLAFTERFSAKGVPGWRTDRGRIYIMFGPPDEIDSHPTGGSYARPPQEGGGTISTFPFEQWTYRYIEEIGNNVKIDFVDQNMTGEYHMTTDPAEKDVQRTRPNPQQ